MKRALVLMGLLSAIVVIPIGCGAADGVDGGQCEVWLLGSGGGASTASSMCVPKPPSPDSSCPGQCVAKVPIPWSQIPVLLWIGEGTPPDCPAERAPSIGFEGVNDPVGTITCDICKCAPPTGTCTLSTTMTLSSELCQGDGPGAIHTSFDAPAGWTGGCTSVNGIPAGQQCGSGPCVKSLTIEPPIMQETSCAVKVVAPVPKLASRELSFKSRARQCQGPAYDLPGGCEGDLGAMCVPSSEPPPPGFHQCVWREGEITTVCPDPYTERHVFYESYEDTRTCTDCSCGAPIGSACTTQVVLYTDAGCTSMLASQTVTSIAPAPCQDLPPGTALLSKASLNTKYTPGTCQPMGGEPVGEVVLNSPMTFCCIPE